MPFWNYILTPRLIRDYNHPNNNLGFYGYVEESNLILQGSLKLFSFIFWAITFFTCFLLPIAVIILIVVCWWKCCKCSPKNCGFGIIRAALSIFIFVLLWMCILGVVGSQNEIYTNFVELWEKTENNPRNVELRKYDYGFDDWPVNYEAFKCNRNFSNNDADEWSGNIFTQTLAYAAMHTFGIRMIYPGTLLHYFIDSTLADGRQELIQKLNGKRNKVKTCDGNEIDTIFVDNRQNAGYGKTLVVCSEGNGGFYEIGVIGTPLDLGYSILGWNHPGFAGSTGQPYPDQERNAIDSVMQFAISLGFSQNQIILFGWSIGGYSTLIAASMYPEVQGVVMDAPFDDVLMLAMGVVPKFLSLITEIGIRDYCNLNNTRLITKYVGPIKIIRRLRDEFMSVNNDLETNRANFLLIHMLKYRYPNIFDDDMVKLVKEILSHRIELQIDSTPDDKPCESLSESNSLEEEQKLKRQFPNPTGSNLTKNQKVQIVRCLIKRHMIDFSGKHNDRLPGKYFPVSWTVSESKGVIRKFEDVIKGIFT